MTEKIPSLPDDDYSSLDGDKGDDEIRPIFNSTKRDVTASLSDREAMKYAIVTINYRTRHIEGKYNELVKLRIDTAILLGNVNKITQFLIEDLNDVVETEMLERRNWLMKIVDDEKGTMGLFKKRFAEFIDKVRGDINVLANGLVDELAIVPVKWSSFAWEKGEIDPTGFELTDDKWAEIKSRKNEMDAVEGAILKEKRILEDMRKVSDEYLKFLLKKLEGENTCWQNFCNRPHLAVEDQKTYLAEALTSFKEELSLFGIECESMRNSWRYDSEVKLVKSSLD